MPSAAFLHSASEHGFFTTMRFELKAFFSFFPSSSLFFFFPTAGPALSQD